MVASPYLTRERAQNPATSQSRMSGKPQPLFLCKVFAVCDQCVSREHSCFHAQCTSLLFVYVRDNMHAFMFVFVTISVCPHWIL